MNAASESVRTVVEGHRNRVKKRIQHCDGKDDHYDKVNSIENNVARCTSAEEGFFSVSDLICRFDSYFYLRRDLVFVCHSLPFSFL